MPWGTPLGARWKSPALVIVESALAKKGEAPARGARQWDDSPGKMDNGKINYVVDLQRKR